MSNSNIYMWAIAEMPYWTRTLKYSYYGRERVYEAGGNRKQYYKKNS